MNTLVPNRFLFDFEFTVPYCAKPPRIDGKLADWSDAQLLPKLGALDDAREFADVWACWHETGLSVACRVAGKKRQVRCDPKSFWTSDHLRLCTDMRDARAVKRATRFCQQFHLLPSGGGRGGKDAVAGVGKIKRAKEDAPLVDATRIDIAAKVTKTGYSMEAFIPAQSLAGFDPEQHGRIGLYYIVEDTELGQQYPTVGDDLYWYIDPSTWPTAVLQR